MKFLNLNIYTLYIVCIWGFFSALWEHDLTPGIGIFFGSFENVQNLKLEDLKVLRRSPDHFYNVKIGHGQLQLKIKHILFYNI